MRTMTNQACAGTATGCARRAPLRVDCRRISPHLPRPQRYVCSSMARFRIASPISLREFPDPRCATINNLAGIVCHQNFAARLEKRVDAFPVVGDDTGAGAGRFEDTRRRREAHLHHRLAIQVQHRGAPNSSRRCGRRCRHAQSSEHSLGGGFRPNLRRPARTEIRAPAPPPRRKKSSTRRLTVRQAIAHEDQVAGTRSPRIGEPGECVSRDRARCKSDGRLALPGAHSGRPAGGPPP